MNKFIIFVYGILTTLTILIWIYCGWFVYDSLDSRIIKLENRNFIDIHFIKE